MMYILTKADQSGIIEIKKLQTYSQAIDHLSLILHAIQAANPQSKVICNQNVQNEVANATIINGLKEIRYKITNTNISQFTM